MERVLRIHQALKSGSFPNATTLAAEFEVSAKSIQRDIAFMSDRLSLPIAYNAQKFGYHYTAKVESLPSLQITEGELFALLVAEKALQQYRGTSFERPLLSAIKKMQASLPETITFNLAEWERSISFRTSAEPILDLQIFDQLSRATAAHQQIRIDYQKPGRNSVEPRVVNPYHLANINGEWYLFAFDQLRKAIRTFVPSRIKSVRLTGEEFKLPPGFSPAVLLSGSFGVVSGAGEYDVLAIFDKNVAVYIREKRWHHSQRLRERKGGKIELRLRLSGLDEVKRWLLGWGRSVSVVQPTELVNAVREEARGILKKTKARAR